ncbi:MAG: C_GCAxxG_C_C family protein [Ruminococcus sp.]|nr:C_GCAxxG_C_C family protein [Ruminococcus sp.]
MNYADKARGLFKEGYNCSQAVLLAFSDVTGLDDNTALMLASSFGGGMGRLREVCGAVSGMFMVIGILCGYSSPADHAEKTAHYERIQELAAQFREKNGSIICRELLGLGSGADSPVPEHRTQAYYRKRPCAEIVADAAEITELYLRSIGKIQ